MDRINRVLETRKQIKLRMQSREKLSSMLHFGSPMSQTRFPPTTKSEAKNIQFGMQMHGSQTTFA